MKQKPPKILHVGDNRLREKSLPVTDFDAELTGLIGEMFRSLQGKKGLGLAAVQVGKLLRVFITSIPEDAPRVFINPELLETSEDQADIEEGCLSVPNKFEYVLRPAAVKVQAFTPQGKPFSVSAHGILARVIQHELDHLNGVLFIDRIDAGKRDLILKAFQKKVII